MRNLPAETLAYTLLSSWKHIYSKGSLYGLPITSLKAVSSPVFKLALTCKEAMEGKLCSCNRPFSDDYDAFKPCFFDEVDTEEEFYDAPAPSEDIWKKFELLPTPPRSPKHETTYPAGLMNSTLEKLQMVSDILEPITLSADFAMFPDDCAVCSRDTYLSSAAVDCEEKEQSQSLKSNLIQDCMWSGHMGITLDTKCKENTSYGTSLCNTDASVSTTVCVNPQSVFPFPLNEKESATADNLELDTPSDSDYDVEEEEEACSEDDDDDDDAGSEEEEIDVVSVSSVSESRRSPISDHGYTVSIAPAVSHSAQVAAMHNYNAPHPTSIVKCESPVPTSSPSQSRKRQRSLVGRPPKRARLALHLTATSENKYKVSRGRYSAASSRSSSDSEDGADGNKRSQHNILERKRRNDLKYSFHRLRDHVPDLCTQERAPKVVILKKATDYIIDLQRTSQSLQAEQDRLRTRREQLKQKLKLLQRQ